MKDKDEKCYFCLKDFEEVGGKFYVFIDEKMRRAHKKCHSQYKIEIRKTNITVIMK
ncbi:unnamed protein product [marine sediment metagenome]|uniref:Uncharacterized protein n=1 Tax=marine sediment metagenome TaxID=412755 RepID=X1T5B6_9ZZZZ